GVDLDAANPSDSANPISMRADSPDRSDAFVNDRWIPLVQDDPQNKDSPMGCRDGPVTEVETQEVRVPPAVKTGIRGDRTAGPRAILTFASGPLLMAPVADCATRDACRA